MTDITVNAKICKFNKLSKEQQEKLINNFTKSQADCWEGFYDFNCDMELILKEYPEFLKIFDFCEDKTRYNISFSQGDYANIGIKSINLKEWLKIARKEKGFEKLAKSLLRSYNAFNQFNDNIDICQLKFKYEVEIQEYYIEDNYCVKYKDLINYFHEDIKESIETINRLVYRYLSDSLLSCYDNDFAREELSQVNYTVVNGIIVSQD